MRPKIAIVLSGYGIVPRGAELMLEGLLPHLADRFDLHVYSRSGRGPGGVGRPAIPRSAWERLYRATHVGRKILDTLATERGRDPSSITISVYGQSADRDLIQSFLNAGADRVVVAPKHCETEAEMGEQMERMAEAVIR